MDLIRIKNYTWPWFLTILVLFSACESPELQDSVIKIENALVIDGTGKPAYLADIWVADDRIISVGLEEVDLVPKQVIDAAGLMAAPGFIDLHAHGDPRSSDTSFENFLYQGVTSICIGMDGFSGDSMFVEANSGVKLGLNVLPFVGHSTLRNLAGIGYDPNPDNHQLELLEGLLDSAFRMGYHGLSLGLEYRPGGIATENELMRLAEVVGMNGKMITSHVRNEDDDQVESSIGELILMGARCRVHVSHIKVVYGKGSKRAEELLIQLNQAREAGVRITADLYPYTASYTGIGIVFPEWAKPPANYDSVKKMRRRDLEDYIRARVVKRNGPEATLLGTGPFSGMTLKQVSDSLNEDFVRILIDRIGPGGASGAYFIMDEPLQERLMIEPFVAIASDGSPTMNHPRGYGTFPKVLGKYVRQDSLLSWENAIRKMTSLPADILGLPDRGRLLKNFKADLVLFDPATIADKATYESPHLPAEGVRWLLIDGQIVIQNGVIITDQGGRVISGKSEIH